MPPFFYRLSSNQISEYPKMSGMEDFIGMTRGGDDACIGQCSVANTKSILANLTRKKSYDKVMKDMQNI